MKYLTKAAFILCALASNAATASELDPFVMDSGTWLSVERYDDKSQRFPGLFPKEEAPPPEWEEAKNEQKAEEPQPELLLRQVTLPVLPGFNKGYGILVSSTAEEEPALAQPSRPLNLPVMPAISQRIHVPTGENEDAYETTEPMKFAESLWQNAKTASAHLRGAENKKAPLNIRLAGLPDASVTPIPAKSATPEKTKTPQKIAKKPADDDKNPEVCAAVTEHKKRLLAAIESDRKTLKALQDAIAELGLSKELDFLGGAQGAMQADASGDKPPNQVSITAPLLQSLPDSRVP